jgi:MFS family permease
MLTETGATSPREGGPIPGPAGAPRGLLGFEFVGVCAVNFLAFCNVTVFYDLFGHLQALGIPAELRGVVIGAYSLTAMVLYAVASPLVSVRNAPRVMLVGIAILGASNVAYLFVHSFWGLLSLRTVSGAGQFCLGSGAATLLVSVIPPGKSGQAFGVYSSGILVAYAAVPALMDALAPIIPTPPHGYAAAALSLLPAWWIVRRIGRSLQQQRPRWSSAPLRLARAEVRADLSQLPVALLIALNVSYFANWSSLFFLFKGFAREEGLPNVGTFFLVQTGLMIVMRVGAGRIFDRVGKAWLVAASFVLVASGHLAFARLPGAWAVPWIGVVFGLGMGAGYPALNGLMFEVSEPRFRPLNANLMLFAVQAGSFLGPTIGGGAVARHGYRGYFLLSTALALTAVAVSLTLIWRRRARPA